ncbi:hypothetical protein HEP86_20120 [Streptomyces sp. RPA4-5]|uniref:hypothetical protein n=1 Tax=Streptomyces TaxID=1883 RepID=UPI00143EA9FB|nr:MULTISPECIES: hypothetical protein [Streptomyces]MCX4639296.1 hypothetical protein [Streptomyces platensis]QIY56408.1 hypothetical protein HEP86_20120 [Streptomyces sp. RPA4-5]WJY39290.1 hypothetical protein QT196_19530 [Streptomyces sp. P9-2B-2]
MRHGFTSEIDTCEIADTELDNIAGGLAGAGAEVAGHGAAVNVGNVVSTVGAGGSITADLPGAHLGAGAGVQATSL